MSVGADGALRAFACLEGNEPRVLDELKTLLPGASPAGQAAHAGLVLVRDPSAPDDIALAPPVHPAFARAEFTAWGEASDSDLRDLASEVAAAIADALDDPKAPPALHVWPQGESHREARARDAKSLEKALRRALGGRVLSKVAADVGQEVIDVACVGPPGEPRCVYGAHVRTLFMSAFPGGQRRLAAKKDLPSRAHLKIEEGLEWAALPLSAGDVAIDIGCAPGGWSAILLERGLVVHGVDPTPVAPAIASHERFVSHKIPTGKLRIESPDEVRWIFCDMNGPPRDALAQVLRLLPRLPRIEGLFHTIKLSDDPPMETLAHVRDRLSRAGFSEVRVRHLYHNRDELTVVATRR